MKKLIFIKEFFNKRTTINYFIIIFSVLFVISIAISCYEYGKKILNDNYKKSYYIVVLDNSLKYEQIKNHNNIELLEKCIVFGDEIIIEKDNDNNLLEQNNIKLVSKQNFNNYEYKDEYYITLKKWTSYNDMVDYLIKNNINYEIFLNKENENKLENYYNYFFYILIILIIISVVIYIISIINILIDEQKYNHLYYCLGFNFKEILIIFVIKVFSLILSIILFNTLFQAIIKYFLEINHSFNFLTNIIVMILTLLIIMFWIVERSVKDRL